MLMVGRAGAAGNFLTPISLRNSVPTLSSPSSISMCSDLTTPSKQPYHILLSPLVNTNPMVKPVNPYPPSRPPFPSYIDPTNTPDQPPPPAQAAASFSSARQSTTTQVKLFNRTSPPPKPASTPSRTPQPSSSVPKA